MSDTKEQVLIEIKTEGSDRLYLGPRKHCGSGFGVGMTLTLVSPKQVVHLAQFFSTLAHVSFGHPKMVVIDSADRISAFKDLFPGQDHYSSGTNLAEYCWGVYGCHLVHNGGNDCDPGCRVNLTVEEMDRVIMMRNHFPPATIHDWVLGVTVGGGERVIPVPEQYQNLIATIRQKETE